MPRRSHATAHSSDVLVGLLRLLPHLTLGELLDAEPSARSVTLGQLLGTASSTLAEARNARAPRTNGKPATKNGAKRSSSRSVETRSVAGRGDYDARVLAVIADIGGPVAAEQVIGKIGGAPMQFRAATKRLLKSRKLKRTGKARGTRYEAT